MAEHSGILALIVVFVSKDFKSIPEQISERLTGYYCVVTLL